MASPDQPRSGTNGNTSQARKVPQMLRALSHRNFQLFFSGQMISLVGTWMDNIAEAWLVYRLTGSSLLLGHRGICGADSGFLAGSDRRDGGRSMESPADRDCDASLLDGARGNSRGINADASGNGVGSGGTRGADGSGERVRYSRAPGFLGRYGGPRRFVERNRAQLIDVQWRTRDWAFHRGNPRGDHR